MDEAEAAVEVGETSQDVGSDNTDDEFRQWCVPLGGCDILIRSEHLALNFSSINGSATDLVTETFLSALSNFIDWHFGCHILHVLYTHAHSFHQDVQVLLN